mmetsp:Transcript_14050/g.36347  ORF Transcript_14050/g.36347 Transcript_14050/m.36347 type:complete len:778 (-) Transcript_14050:321-2654(-)
MGDAPAAKEALCVVLDVSARMQPHLTDALDAVRMLVNSKILFQKQDVVGIVLHGTEDTRNAVATEYGDEQYLHISEAHPMAPVNYRTLEALDRSAEAPAVDPEDSADLIDSLCVGMAAVNAYVGKLKFAKRVILLTDGTSPANTEGEGGDQLEPIAQQLRDSKIKFDVYGIGIDSTLVEDDEAGANEDDDNEAGAARLATLRVLRRLEEAVGPDLFTLTPMGKAREALEVLKKSAVRSSTSFRGPLDIGGVGLPIWSWRKVVAATAPSYKPVSKAALDDPEMAAAPEKTVIAERRSIVPTRPEEEIPPDQITPAYRFGRDLVPIDRADGERLKYGLPSKQLQLLGLVQRDDVPRHLLTSRPECVVPPPEGNAGCDANKALQCLLLVLAEQDLVAIARYAPRAKAAPQLVVLSPAVNCFWMVQVPFADDVQTFEWGAPPPTVEPSTAGIEAASKLIDAFDLMAPAGEDDAKPVEAIKPTNTYNPKLQRHYQCIHHRARAMISGAAGGASASALPPPDVRFMAPLQPNEGMLERAAPALEAFAAQFPLRGVAAGGKRPRGGARSPTSEPSDLEGKKAKTDTSTVSTGSMGGGGGGGALQLAYHAPTQIDTAHPTTTFWAMLDDSETDRVDAALGQMAEVVLELLRQVQSERELSQPSGSAQKGLQALREFRRGSLMYYSPRKFNETLRTLRDLYRDEGSGRAFLWREIASQISDASSQLSYGLIVVDEIQDVDVEQAAVSLEEAAAFMAPLATPAAPALPAASIPAVADDFDDDLDELT